MSNKSGVSDQIISLPEGGGALSGLSEKFAPDPFTGTGNFTVPIELPEGRNEFQPDLNLQYSTGNGNGPFGLGWKFSVPGVRRKTADGNPIYVDSEDTFVLSEAEDLVPVETPQERSPPSSVTQTAYRPRTEGLFARIHHHTSPTTDHWEVQTTDGLRHTYATPEQRENDPAVTANPSNPGRVFAWHVTRTEDTYGNHIVYEYRRDAGNDGAHRWDRPLLNRIRYVDIGTLDDEPTYLVSISFEYEDRPDPFSDYRAGFERRTSKRCSRIAIRMHADDDELIRTYEFTYNDERSDRSLPLNGVSLLSTVTVIGHDGEDTQQLPPIEFDYTGFEPSEREFAPLEGTLPARSLAEPELELADLFGNGLPDVVEIGDTIRYWRNRGDGEFDTPRPMRTAPAGLSLADSGVQLIDANGNGRIDLLVTTSGLAGYFPLGLDGEWDRDSFQRYSVAPSVDLDDPEIQLVDLDGDGVTDAIRSGTRFECFFNDPDEGWTKTQQVVRHGSETFPDVSFSDPRVKWGDFSGDGLQDIALVHDGTVSYWPNLGHGKWGDRVRMRNSPQLPYGYNPERLLVGDIDGDGLADIVYVEDNRVYLWINQSGNRWSDPITIRGTPGVTDVDAVRLVDVLGTGVTGLLWSADDRGNGDHTFFLDFTGGTKPYLLDEMDNHMGAIIRVGYAPSTTFYLEDQRRPETRWETPLPFPVQVISRVESIDAISGGKLTTEYRYRHGYWDSAEREFHGFGMVEQRDSETFDDYNGEGLHGRETPFAEVGMTDRKQFSPPTTTKTWFYQGPVGDATGDWDEPNYRDEYWRDDSPMFSRPDSMRELLGGLARRDRRDALRTLRGRVLRTEVYARDGTDRKDRPYSVTEKLHAVREEVPPDEAERGRERTDGRRKRIFFPHERATRTTEWERGTDPKTKLMYTGRYDEYGQPGSETSIAVPRGRNPRRAVEDADGDETDPYLATVTTTEYAQRDDDTAYIVDRVARTTTHEIQNDGREDVLSLTERSDRTIDRETHSEASIVAQTVNFYDGDAFRGKAFGTVGIHGALVRTETLALTDEILRDAYEGDDGSSVPSYLRGDAGAEWEDYPADVRSTYPKGFVEGLPSKESVDLTRPGLRITPTGHGLPDGFDDGGVRNDTEDDIGDPYALGYFVASKRCAYDFQLDPDRNGRGLLARERDELGRETEITHDEFDLLPTVVEEPVGLTTTARYNYRTFEPAVVTDPNGNETAYAYTPLGLPERIAVMGKEGEQAGDTLDQPGTAFVYDLEGFDRRGEPISVETIQRVAHRWDLVADDPDKDPDALFPPDERERFPERFVRTCEYTDGFYRLVQTRTQAEAVVVGDPTFGGDALLIDQAVLVRADDLDAFTSDRLKDVLDHAIGVEIGTVGARLAERLVADSDRSDSPIETYGSARAAVTSLEGGEVDVVIVDKSVATGFEARGTVAVAVTSGPGEVIGTTGSDDDSPRVVVSGWKTYDNKGNVVEQYEPFFDNGFAFRSRREHSGADGRDVGGQKLTKYFDPRERVVRTVYPDGSEELVVYGVPGSLDEPEAFEPSPWEIYTYDENNNAGRTHAITTSVGRPHLPEAAPEHHWNTPTNHVVDALGRTIERIERTRDDPDHAPDAHRTASSYDIRDNERTLTDALDREAFRYEYDLLDRPLRTESIDAGVRIVVRDAAGNELERRDAKSALVVQAYDERSRPIRRWARDGEGDPLTLREHLVYGDAIRGDIGDEDAADRNLLGERYQHYDEAGLLAFDRYDFKGNVVEKRRWVLGDDLVRSESPVDWRPPDGTSLAEHAEAVLDDAGGDIRDDRGDDGEGAGNDSEDTDDASWGRGFQTTVTYDALDRPVSIRYPMDVDGDRKELRPTYNRAGALESADLVRRPGTDDEAIEPFVEHVAYDAAGQRTFIAYGNGIMTRYAYAPETFRLVRMRTDQFTRSNVSDTADRADTIEFTYRPEGTVLQDYAYAYDLAGNVMTIRNRTPESGVVDSPLGRHAFDRTFAYDPLYRLVSATGRECGSAANRRPWDPRPRCHDRTRTRPYMERYEYDRTGNVRELRHASGDHAGDTTDDGSFTRRFSIADEHNRLEGMTVGEVEYPYVTDDAGNLRREGADRRFEWDHAGHLRTVLTGGADDDPSLRMHARYDAEGQRVLKLVEKHGGRLERTVYVDGLFEHYRVTQGDETSANDTLHVMDDERRVALVRVGDPLDDDDTTPAVRVPLGDHLDSTTVVVDGNGTAIDREEYTPFGETSFGSFDAKRYRHTGAERDAVSGLDYHGARYYAPWKCRWTAPDPVGPVEGLNGYVYGRNNPVRFTDPSGTQARSSDDEDGPTPPVRNVEFPPDIITAEEPDRSIDEPPGSRTEQPSKETVTGTIDRGAVAEEFSVWMEAMGTINSAIGGTGAHAEDIRWKRAYGQLDWAIPKSPYLVADVTDTPAWHRISIIERVTSHPAYRGASAGLGTIAAVADLVNVIRDPSVQNIANFASSVIGLAGGAVGAAFSFGYSIGRFADWLTERVTGTAISDFGTWLYDFFHPIETGDGERGSAIIEPLEPPGRLPEHLIRQKYE